MSRKLRQSGVDLIDGVPWGTHFCQFYQTKNDLIDILVPYFKAGLENNEFCVWVTSKPLEVEEAKEAMQNAVENFDRYLDEGQIEIISYDAWYLKEDSFNSDRALNGWIKKLGDGLNRGYDGLRLSGNTFWLEQRDWNDFVNYENEIDAVISEYNMLALCTYCLDNCGANEIIDVVNNHQFTVIKRDGKWTLLESLKQKKILKKLEDSRSRYSSLFDNMLNGYAHCEMIFDENGKAVDYKHLNVNEAFENLTGLKDVTGKKISEIVPETKDEHPELLEKYARVAATGVPEQFEIYFKPLDKWFNISVHSPERNHFITVFENITKRKKHDEIMDKALKKYSQLNKTLRALRDSSHVMTHASDEDSYLEDLCRIIVDDCGHSLVWIGFIDENTQKVVPVAYAGFDNNYIENLNIKLDDTDRGCGPTGTAIRTGKPCICENMHTDPKFKPWREEALKRGYSSSIVLPLMSDGKAFGALNIYSIETNPFSYEETALLKELADDISYGIKSLKLKIAHEKAEKALRESLIEVERSNAELEQFAYVTSHDLREPLRMISSFLQLLERRYGNKLDEEAKEFIGYAVDGAQRLDAMINDILLYSRVANKEKQFTKVRCEKVLDEAYLNLKASIEETNTKISIEPLPTLVMDEHLMIQLFQNLLSNAIKYRSDETPKIHVFTKKEDNHWLFGVKDNGIGISKEHAEKIFTIFQRLHTKDEYEGTGIGLAIAQKIVHQHGGDIWVESEPGEGSTFYFTIPETISDIYDI